ncbi:MAG: glutamyl-tRNA reductase [Acidobacteria bacterium]|nr:glutamyl-tRNA reductase [Acidobacteriota bacterium]
MSHKTAPIELRERIDFSAGGLKDALRALASRPPLAETAIVSTCNRAEIYSACRSPEVAREDLLDFLRDFHHLDRATLAPHVYERLDGDAALHLFRVAGGLDSLVVGEPQILGQVKDAYTAASELQSVGPLLTRLFHWSFAAGKRVRTETQLAEGAVSISYAAVSLARKIFGDLRGRRVMVIGAGEMGKLTAIHLRAQGIERVVITSRTAAHAEALATSVSGTAIPWNRLLSGLEDSDIVITATGSPTPFLTRAQIEPVRRARHNQPLFFIDIGLPRDIEAAVGEIDNVFLYNIDDLQSIVRDNLSRRQAEVAHAEAIVREEAGHFLAWFHSRGAIPTVVALRQRFEAVRKTELERLQPKLAALPPETRTRIDEITRLIIEKLLLTPTEQLKSLGDPELVTAYADALNRLFSLSHDPQAASDQLESTDVTASTGNASTKRS